MPREGRVTPSQLLVTENWGLADSVPNTAAAPPTLLSVMVRATDRVPLTTSPKLVLDGAALSTALPARVLLVEVFVGSTLRGMVPPLLVTRRDWAGTSRINCSADATKG